MTWSLLGVDDPGPIKHAVKGMSVVDRAGHDVGAVAEVMRDEAHPRSGQGRRGPGSGARVVDRAGGFTAGTSLPGQHQERLVRLGCLRIRATGLLVGDLYVAAEHVIAVSGDRVQLDVPAAALDTA